jgi:hypothetical protein
MTLPHARRLEDRNETSKRLIVASRFLFGLCRSFDLAHDDLKRGETPTD